MKRSLTILVALETGEQASKAACALEGQGCSVVKADSLAAFDAAMAGAEAVLVGVDFAGGAVADWLSLWPVPAVIVAEQDTDPDRLADLCSDEASSFVLKDDSGRWYGHLTPMLRKAVAVRESLDRQNSNIIRAESSYMNLLRVIPDIVYVLDSDGCFVYVNDAIGQLGWKPTELVGKHFAELVHPDDLPEVGRSLVLNRFQGRVTGSAAAPKLFDERRTGERRTKDLVVRIRHKYNYEWTTTKVDSWGEVASLGVALPEFQGLGVGTVGVIRDISERRRNEENIRARLESREMLIKEIHHRVKNNLQVVSSILNLQGSRLEAGPARDVFLDCQSQVHSMSLVHEQIYRGSSLEKVDAGACLERLAEYLGEVHDSAARGIEIRAEVDPILMELEKAIPLSIVVTELVSNACKHAFKGRERGSIVIRISERDSTCRVEVRDDGTGQDPEGDESPSRRSGLGTELVGALASQLGGRIERDCRNGTAVVLEFPAC